MERPAQTVVGSGVERRDYLVEIAAGDDCDDRNPGCLAAKISAELCRPPDHDEHDRGLEHTQEAGRTPVLGDRQDIVSFASQRSRELGLRIAMNEEDPYPIGGRRAFSHG